MFETFSEISLERRTLLLGLSAALLARGIPGEVGKASAENYASPEPRIFVFDRRSGDARQIAGHLSRRGTTTYPINGDVTQFWTGHLLPLVRERPVWIGGITTASSLFCLEQMVSRYRMVCEMRTDFSEQPRQVAHAFSSSLAGMPPLASSADLPSSSVRLLDADRLVAWLVRPTRGSTHLA
jgi:hypothetical protein